MNLETGRECEFKIMVREQVRTEHDTHYRVRRQSLHLIHIFSDEDVPSSIRIAMFLLLMFIIVVAFNSVGAPTLVGLGRAIAGTVRAEAGVGVICD